MSDTPAHRTQRVDWLELFFDLVFVVIIKQLTGMLHRAPDLADFTQVVGLFVLVWIAWLNVTTFVNLSGDRTIDRRIPVLFSMAGVALIAIAIPTATSEGALLFLIGLAVARIAIWPLWIRVDRAAGRGVVRATVYGPGFATLWLASIFVPEQVRPWAWVALVLAEVIYMTSTVTRAAFAVSHLLERVGLFIMIVLGESVVELILAVQLHQSAIAWAVSAGGFVVVCSIWWHYYQAGAPLSERMLGRSSGAVVRDVLVVAHYFIVLGLIGIAAGLGAAIEYADEAHLPYGSVVALGGGIGLYHLANVIMAARYGVNSRDILVIGVLGAVVVALILTCGAVWPGWVLVALLLLDSLITRLLAPWVTRRNPTLAV